MQISGWPQILSSGISLVLHTSLIRVLDLFSEAWQNRVDFSLFLVDQKLGCERKERLCLSSHLCPSYIACRPTPAAMLLSWRLGILYPRTPVMFYNNTIIAENNNANCIATSYIFWYYQYQIKRSNRAGPETPPQLLLLFLLTFPSQFSTSLIHRAAAINSSTE